jgi:hypothetical protein
MNVTARAVGCAVSADFLGALEIILPKYVNPIADDVDFVLGEVACAYVHGAVGALAVDLSLAAGGEVLGCAAPD